MRLVHFGEKNYSPHNVFYVVLEIVICKIFSFHFDKTLTEIHICHVSHKSALKSKNSQSLRETI